MRLRPSCLSRHLRGRRSCCLCPTCRKHYSVCSVCEVFEIKHHVVKVSGLGERAWRTLNSLPSSVIECVCTCVCARVFTYTHCKLSKSVGLISRQKLTPFHRSLKTFTFFALQLRDAFFFFNNLDGKYFNGNA